MERILKSSHKLKLLDVRGCSRVSDSSLVRVPAWDLEHLFLSGKFCWCTACKNLVGYHKVVAKLGILYDFMIRQIIDRFLF